MAVDFIHVLSPALLQSFYLRGVVILINTSQETTLHDPVRNQHSIQNDHLASISIRKLPLTQAQSLWWSTQSSPSKCSLRRANATRWRTKKRIDLSVFRGLRVITPTVIQMLYILRLVKFNLIVALRPPRPAGTLKGLPWCRSSLCVLGFNFSVPGHNEPEYWINWAGHPPSLPHKWGDVLLFEAIKVELSLRLPKKVACPMSGSGTLLLTEKKCVSQSEMRWGFLPGTRLFRHGASKKNEMSWFCSLLCRQYSSETRMMRLRNYPSHDTVY